MFIVKTTLFGGKQIRKYVLTLFFLSGLSFLVGCVAAPPSAPVSVTADMPILATTATPTELVSPTPIITPTLAPVIRKTPTVLPDDGIHFVVRDRAISQITIDDDYLYWTCHDEEKLYRIPLEGGDKEVIATSHYDQGSFSVMPLVRTGGWLIFMDTPTGREEGRQDMANKGN